MKKRLIGLTLILAIIISTIVAVYAVDHSDPILGPRPHTLMLSYPVSHNVDIDSHDLYDK